MKVLIVDDDPVWSSVTDGMLKQWGYEATVRMDGASGWQALQEANAPSLVLLDWMLPDMEGVDICRRLRRDSRLRSLYVILVTSRRELADVVTGIQAGADDFLSKPIEPAELRARIETGKRILGLQEELSGRVRELEAAMAQIKQLRGIIPMCMYCKKIRDDKKYWQQVESYVEEHSDAQFSHGICPGCAKKVLEGLEGPLRENRG
jgi:phosphoserine phosphatase RsbU/P